LEIDTSAPGFPDTPTIGAITDDVGADQGPLNDGDSTDDTTPTLSGGGLALGDTVDIYDGGELIGTADVLADGTWSFTPPTPLNDGDHVLTIIAQDPAGNRSDESAPWTIIVDTTPPDVPTLDSVYDDQGTIQDFLAPGDVTDDATPTLRGTGEANGQVVIYDFGVEIGRADVQSDGTWVFEPSLPLANGPHELTVKAVDTVGNLSAASDPFDFTLLAGGAPAAPA
ncbi:Ig-like domain-containing protein, partial [Pseudomonas sp. SED1]|uniref:Ig-like domain-containing protein n=1 Tax=Pseudomonas sp. SED1 TaxID=3056845 RepID=UPI00296F62C5